MVNGSPEYIPPAPSAGLAIANEKAAIADAEYRNMENYYEQNHEMPPRQPGHVVIDPY